MTYCGAHRLVRLRPDGECRLCTLEAIAAADVRKAECACVNGFTPVLWGCPVHQPSNDWCHLSVVDVVEEGSPFAHEGHYLSGWSLEHRAEYEHNARTRVIIDDHPGYTVMPREFIKNVQHIRYIGEVDDDNFDDFEHERRAANLYDDLPEEMRKAIEAFDHRMHGVQHERRNVEDAWLTHGLIGGDVLHDLRGVLARVDWQLSRRWGWGSGGLGKSWHAEPITRGSRLSGARERVHQPLYDTAIRGIGRSTVQNMVGLFQTPNPNIDDLE